MNYDVLFECHFKVIGGFDSCHMRRMSKLNNLTFFKFLSSLLLNLGWNVKSLFLKLVNLTCRVIKWLFDTKFQLAINFIDR